MTKRECAIIMAYTGAVMLTGEDTFYFYEYLYDICGRPIFTHEIGTKADEIKAKSKNDFIELCKSATKIEQPSRIGRWIETDALRFDRSRKELLGVTAIKCSICMCAFIPDNGVNAASRYKFCPSCGARMEGGKHNA